MLYEVELSKKIVLCLFVSSLSFLFDCHSQHYITVSSGVSLGKLFNFKSESPSELKYNVKGGFCFSLILDSLNRDKHLRLALEYGQQNLGIYERNYDKFGAGGISNYTIHFQYFQIDLAYKFQLVSKPKYSLTLFAGPTFLYSNEVRFNGFGETTVMTMITDSLGQMHPYYSNYDWQKTNEKTSDFAKNNFGLNIGLCCQFPLTKRIHLTLENKFNLFLKNTTQLVSYYHTFLARNDLSLGVRFKI